MQGDGGRSPLPLRRRILGLSVLWLGFVSWFSCDNWNFNASNPVVYAGGNYSQNGNHGLFYVNYTSATNQNANHGSRILLVLLTLCFLAQAVAHPTVKISN